MFGKNQKRKGILCSVFFAAALIFASCDMTYIDDSSTTRGSGGSREISQRERDELERTGHFLKLTNMPLNTQVPNVFSVQVANSASVIAKLEKDSTALIYRDINASASTVYLPLTYNDDTEFIETGFFYSAFTVHVDAVTKYIVEVSDKYLVSFTDGRGEADVRYLPEKILYSADPRYLTIYNLPANLSVHNFSNVLVHNQAGPVAKCSDYSLIEITEDGLRASARIPLQYNNLDSVFKETGYYYVSFDINIDAELRYLFTAEDKVQVSFYDGNGFLDILNIPEKPVPCLTISGLPFYTAKDHFTNIAVYNLAGQVASCNDNSGITIVSGGQNASALIPLSSSLGNGWFAGSGPFVITFTLNVDVETQISVTRDLNLTLQFFNGSAAMDFLTFYGYFSAELTDDNVPTIKAGSSFDVDGYRHTVSDDLTVSAFLPYSSGIIYLYAYRVSNNVFFEYSTAAPSYHETKRGYYIGGKRALWKMLFLKESGRFLYKTYMGDDFTHFKNIEVSAADFNSLIVSLPAHYSLNGASNPAAASVTLQPGLYVVSAKGAGGGGGYGAVSGSTITGSSSGGAGGSILELLAINETTVFTAFTGSGGKAAPAPAPSGNFAINGQRLTNLNIGFSAGSGSRPLSSETLTFTNLGALVSFSPISGGGAGGGGSGTFLYSERGYFLCAGGGGGGSGGSYLTPGGAGGAGGVVSSGGGGGAAGFLRNSTNPDAVSTAVGGHGGTGGGINGGSGGQVTSQTSNRNGTNGAEFQLSNTSYPGAGGVASYTDASFDISVPLFTFTYSHRGTNESYGDYLNSYNKQHAPYRFPNSGYQISGASGNGGSTAAVSYYAGSSQEWLNTKNANGAGAAPPTLNPHSYSITNQRFGVITSTSITMNTRSGGNGADLYDTTYNPVLSFSLGEATAGANGLAGGNNRNTSRGGGAAGGAVSNSRPSDGAAGSITIYKIF